MRWFKATRCSGDKNQPGEFVVEDYDGTEWQVQVTEGRMRSEKLTCAKPVCMNRGYECGFDLEWDITESVRKVLTEESAEAK